MKGKRGVLERFTQRFNSLWTRDSIPLKILNHEPVKLETNMAQGQAPLMGPDPNVIGDRSKNVTSQTTLWIERLRSKRL